MVSIKQRLERLEQATKPLSLAKGGVIIQRPGESVDEACKRGLKEGWRAIVVLPDNGRGGISDVRPPAKRTCQRAN